MRGMIIAILVFVLLMFGGCTYKNYGTINEYPVVVNDTQRLADEKKWVVLTNATTFENTDSLMHWKFNSSDLQGKIERGTMYNITAYGWRVPFFSMYPNIIKIEKMGSEQ